MATLALGGSSGVRAGQNRPLFYNFVRIYQTLRITPAAGITDRVWEITDIVRLLENWEGRVETERNERTYNPFGPALG